MSGRHDPQIRVLFEDNHLLGVNKPAGVLVQGDRTGDTTLLELAKDYLKHKYQKPGNVFLGLVHRLDRPVSGVVLFARTSKAASRLANEFRLRRARKIYIAVVRGVTAPNGELTGYVERSHLRSRLARMGGDRAKEARLVFRRIGARRAMSVLEIEPLTGRHHQIRLQLSAAGFPIVGDLKYGAPAPLDDKSIALHALRLVVKHPVRDDRITIEAPPPVGHPWDLFRDTLQKSGGMSGE